MRLKLPPEFNARVRYDEPMSQHTSWHAGGPADVLYTPRDVDDLTRFLQALPPEVPLYWIGLGTNLLVRDGGVRGVVIATPGAFTRIEQRAPDGIYCEAGVPCARIARLCAGWNLGQGGFFSGIPGTLGGALAMNAGAFGDETWRHVAAVQTIDRHGERRRRAAQEFRPDYRQLQWPAGAGEEWFLSAELKFPPEAADAAHSLQALLQRRRDTQPLGLWSCGSVFKNPPNDHAARLIESAGLKGYRVGDAVVSEKHANFIINAGKARAAELEQVLRHVQATVQRAHGVLLEPEVRIIGEPADSAAASGARGGGLSANGGRH